MSKRLMTMNSVGWFTKIDLPPAYCWNNPPWRTVSCDGTSVHDCDYHWGYTCYIGDTGIQHIGPIGCVLCWLSILYGAPASHIWKNHPNGTWIKSCAATRDRICWKSTTMYIVAPCRVKTSKRKHFDKGGCKDQKVCLPSVFLQSSN